MYDIIIIGSGIAGMTAAIYGKRASKKVLVLESNYYGGQIVNSQLVENYPGLIDVSGFELANTLYKQAVNLDVEFVFEQVIKIEKNKVITSNDEYDTKTIIIASGVINKKLNLELEDKFIGKGISYCATCDGALYKDKVVAVVGGGNTALEDTLYLSNICKQVYIIHRKDIFRGENVYIEELKNKKNVEFILNEEVTKLNGDTKLNSINLKNQSLDIDGLFIAIGKTPNTLIYKGIIGLDDYGYIKALEDCKTNIDNVFVAGDIRTKNIRQLVTAASDGAVSATEAINYINKN